MNSYRDYTIGVINVTDDVDEIRVNIRLSDSSTFMLEKSTDATTYESYKESSIILSDAIELHGKNKAKDRKELLIVLRRA